jgi:flagellar FliL protein
MAKKKRDEGADDAEAKAAPAGKKKMMIIAGAAAVVLLGGGGAAYMMMGGEKKEEVAVDAAAAEQAKARAMIDLEEMRISLAMGPGEQRQPFLKLKVALEVANDEIKTNVTPLVPRVVDSFQTFMRELRPADLEGSAGIYRLKEEMMRRVNVAVYPNKVDAILFKEILVQ